MDEAFIPFPRTPHLSGSIQSDDEHLDRESSDSLIADSSLIVEEKLDGSNVGIHFLADGKLILQRRSQLITSQMQGQFDLFRHWAGTQRQRWEEQLQDRYILYGEWMFIRHTIHYVGLSHYFYEFDIFDKFQGEFLDLTRRMELIEKLGVQTVPVIHRGPIDRDGLCRLIGPSRFDARFENSSTGEIDHLMEGLYLRTERNNGTVAGRAKLVRPEFLEKVRQCTEWSCRVPNLLKAGLDIWS